MIAIILSLVVLLLAFMWYMGVFQKFDISNSSFKGGFYIYYDY